jgi:hypothetical protein
MGTKNTNVFLGLLSKGKFDVVTREEYDLVKPSNLEVLNAPRDTPELAASSCN